MFLCLTLTVRLTWWCPLLAVIQLRPTEVLFEEWHALRIRGVSTPRIAAWPCVPAGATLFRRLLALYNNENYSDLVMRDPLTDKKLLFVVDNQWLVPDPALLKEIEYNGGRRDVMVVRMWAQMGSEQYLAGTWGFFSPCLAPLSAQPTTSVPGLLSCNQSTTAVGPASLGPEVTASASYQLSYGSLPFGSSVSQSYFSFIRSCSFSFGVAFW